MLNSEVKKGLMIVIFYCILQIILPVIMDKFMKKNGFVNGVRLSLVLCLILFEVFGKKMI